MRKNQRDRTGRGGAPPKRAERTKEVPPFSTGGGRARGADRGEPRRQVDPRGGEPDAAVSHFSTLTVGSRPACDALATRLASPRLAFVSASSGLNAADFTMVGCSVRLRETGYVPDRLDQPARATRRSGTASSRRRRRAPPLRSPGPGRTTSPRNSGSGNGGPAEGRRQLGDDPCSSGVGGGAREQQWSGRGRNATCRKEERGASSNCCRC
jgi:hypothetical protein